MRLRLIVAVSALIVFCYGCCNSRNNCLYEAPLGIVTGGYCHFDEGHPHRCRPIGGV